jgi:tRNA1Val (adenine37-N6)-methyltransferase
MYGNMRAKQRPHRNETLDTIKDVKLFQAKDGYRFSVDAILLENFISTGKLRSGIELGCGSGVISILLAKRMKEVNLTAVEIQKSLAERARRNIQLNGLDDRVAILSKDLRELKTVYETNSFDFVFSNPPFRKPRTGRISSDEERAVARHEIKMTVSDLVSAAAYLLKHSGRFFLIYHPFRLTELITQLRDSRLEPKRMRFVHSMKGEEAKMVLIEAAKGAGVWLKIDPPLFLYKAKHEYSPEVKKIFNK